MSLDSNVVQLIGGLSDASTLFLVAAGLTLVFGAARLINIAHGSLYMFGAFGAATALSRYSGDSGFWVTLVVVPLAVALIGAVLERLVLHRLYGREHLVQLLATLGILYVLADIALHVWGSTARTVSRPSALAGHVSLLGAVLPVYNIFVIAVAVLVGVVLWYVLTRTHAGWRVRAAVEDPETLQVSGTNVATLNAFVFTGGAYLAGLAGVVVAPMITVSPGIDVSILVDAFIVTVIGGLGSVTGAAAGALIIGIFRSMSVVWFPSLSSSVVYLAMILTLAFRPNGLFNVTSR